MHLDVVQLRDFYHGPLGRAVARHIGRRLRLIWPDVRGLNLLGLGYAMPYLSALARRGNAERVIAMMAASQGVHRWNPPGGMRTSRQGNLASITEENAFPLPDGSMNRVLLVHVLETSDRPRALLREAWRVLAPGGKMIAIVPNRTGLWSLLSEQSPFGHGRPYSRSQLEASLTEHMFTPVRHTTALFAPPFKGRMGVRLVMGTEELGAKWWPRFGGVHIIEAEKLIYACGPRPPVRVVKPVPIQTSPALRRTNRP
jgi:SAM-dependent methyltransferase